MNFRLTIVSCKISNSLLYQVSFQFLRIIFKSLHYHLTSVHCNFHPDKIINPLSYPLKWKLTFHYIVVGCLLYNKDSDSEIDRFLINKGLYEIAAGLSFDASHDAQWIMKDLSLILFIYCCSLKSMLGNLNINFVVWFYRGVLGGSRCRLWKIDMGGRRDDQ